MTRFVLTAVILFVAVNNLLFAALQNHGQKNDKLPKHNIYGCVECHPTVLACHIEWPRSKLGEIRKLWDLSFHVKLQKDDFEPFSICYAFFLKGDCFFCHPNILTPDRQERRPQFRSL